MIHRPFERDAVRAWLAAVLLALATPGGLGADPLQISAGARAQMQALAAEKQARTPTQRKIDSSLIYARLRQQAAGAPAGVPGAPVTPAGTVLSAVPRLRVAAPDPDGSVLVDVLAASPGTIKPVLAALRGLGARIVSAQMKLGAVRAHLPLTAVETLAAMPEVRFVKRAARGFVTSSSRLAAARAGGAGGGTDSEGDLAHLASQARAFYGVDGAGIKICALSDGIDSLASLQTAGILPAVDVLPGQAGSGDEGTAMLQILHDLAPGARLGYATATASEASFAQNILGLRNAEHCDILVDDVEYLSELTFQDAGIADAVDQVTAAGALYFASAGNEGNLDAGTSGTWEGDFKANGNLDPLLGAGAGAAHDFGDGGQSDAVTAAASDVVLHWADPAGAACDDYDLYLLDATLTHVVAASTDVQSCAQDPSEELDTAAAAGERVVVVLAAGAPRLFNVIAFRGQLQLATAGCTRGHGSVAAAFSVAAAPAAAAFEAGSPAGPYPGPFTAAQRSEPFTCDGPRRVFFDAAGALLPGAPAGDFSSTGGVVRQKPDFTAADGVSTNVPGFSPFFGTSAAGPHAAAIAALVRSAVPALTPGQVRAALVAGAIDIQAAGADRDTGAGIVMAGAALQAAGAQPLPVLAVGAVTTAQVTGNGDAFVDPGEDWSLFVTLRDAGGAAARQVSATLSSATPGVGFTNATAAYPDIAAGASAANATPFLFTPYAVPCGVPIQFTLTVTYAGAAQPATLTFTVATGHAGAPMTIRYTGPAVAIPDGGNPPGASNEFPGTPAAAALVVSDVAGRVRSLRFSVDGTACTTAVGTATVGVDHSFVNDLTFDLQAPSGTTVNILSRIDLFGHNFCQAVFDDGAAAPIEGATSSQAPFTGTWSPNAALAGFAGEVAAGTWTLTAIDHFGGDTGNLRAFSLEITPAVCAAATAPGVPAAVASLTASKAVTGGTLHPGGTVIYTVTLTNGGTGASFDDPGDEFVDMLPAGLTLSGATATLGTITLGGAGGAGGTVGAIGASTVHWNGGVPAGGNVVIEITATIGAAVPAGTVIANQATVTYDAERTGTDQTTLLTAAPGTGGPTRFAVQAIAAVPTLSPAGLAALALALAGAAALLLRRRPARPTES
jgi:uncharacterized repeat protein (TIGR01451 family)